MFLPRAVSRPGLMIGGAKCEVHHADKSIFFIELISNASAERIDDDRFHVV